QSLLAVPRYLYMLDEWAGREVLTLREQVAESFGHLRSLEGERSRLELDARERARLIDLYSFQTREITEANLTPGEEDELRADSRRLANAQKLAESAAIAANGITGDRGILENLSALTRSLQEA